MNLLKLKKEYPNIFQAFVMTRDCLGTGLDWDLTNDSLLSNINVGSLFSWGDSIEGNDFWKQVYWERMDKAKRILPHYFEEDIW